MEWSSTRKGDGIMSTFDLIMAAAGVSKSSSSITYIGSTSSDHLDTLVLTCPAGTQSGDLGIIFTTENEGGSFTGPSGWTTLYSYTSEDNSCYCYYKILTSTADISITGGTGGDSYQTASLQVFRGASMGAYNKSTATAGSTYTVCPSLSGFVSGKDYVLVGLHATYSSSEGIPSGYTNTIKAGSSSSYSMADAAFKLANSASMGGVAFSGTPASPGEGMCSSTIRLISS